MRQAGRALPSYRALRERYDFIELTSQAELIVEVTMLPFEVAPLDAAILFADLMTPLPAIGVSYRIVEGVGPVIADPIRALQQVDELSAKNVHDELPQLWEAIKLITKELPADVPLLGFAGAPFTLASYLIEGKPDRTFTATRASMSDGRFWDSIMSRLTELSASYLQAQIDAGVEAVQVFDSWAGALTVDEYESHVFPYTKRLIDELSGSVPVIHFGATTRHLLEPIARLGADVISIYHDIPIDEAWAVVGPVPVQGNLDPEAMRADPATMSDAALDVLRRAGGRDGHIFNLGHGLLPDTPVDNVKRLVDLVHEEGSS